MLARGKADIRRLKHAQVLLKADQAEGGPHGRTSGSLRRQCSASRACSACGGASSWRACRPLSPYRVGERVYDQRRLDGEQEAKLIALACSTRPVERGRWSLRLLAGRIAELRRVGRTHRIDAPNKMKRARAHLRKCGTIPPGSRPIRLPHGRCTEGVHRSSIVPRAGRYCASTEAQAARRRDAQTFAAETQGGMIVARQRVRAQQRRQPVLGWRAAGRVAARRGQPSIVAVSESGAASSANLLDERCRPRADACSSWTSSTPTRSPVAEHWPDDAKRLAGANKITPSAGSWLNPRADRAECSRTSMLGAGIARPETTTSTRSAMGATAQTRLCARGRLAVHDRPGPRQVAILITPSLFIR